METEIKEQCPEFPFFGATYPDARCIDGFLHDMDNCDENGRLYLNEDHYPCPFCKQEDFIERNANEDITREDLLEYIEQLKIKYS